MLTERLAEIRARLEKATPGEWEWSGDDLIQSASGESVLDIWPRMDGGKLEIGLDVTRYDRDLIAHAPADLRFLLQVVEEIERNRRLVAYMERNPSHVFGPDYQKGRREALEGVLRDIDRIAKEAGDAEIDRMIAERKEAQHEDA
jgi:hypothetical protein